MALMIKETMYMDTEEYSIFIISATKIIPLELGNNSYK